MKGVQSDVISCCGGHSCPSGSLLHCQNLVPQDLTVKQEPDDLQHNAKAERHQQCQVKPSEVHQPAERKTSQTPQASVSRLRVKGHEGRRGRYRQPVAESDRRFLGLEQQTATKTPR